MTDHSPKPDRIVRRGFTLIEMVLLLSLSAAITAIVVSGIAAMYRYNRSINEYSDQQLAMRRFTRTLRNDIHRAESCQWRAGDQTLVMQLAQSHSLTYHKQQQRWVRSTVKKDSQTRVTSFGLDDSFVCECGGGQFEMGELITLTFSNAVDARADVKNQETRPVQSEIVAQVGRDVRLLND